MTYPVVRAGAVTSTVLLCTALPFLPGPYDPVARALSGTAFVAGILGLALVPLGIAWSVFEVRRGRSSTRDGGRDHAFTFAVIGLALGALAGGLLVVATVPASWVTATIMLLVWACWLRRAARRTWVLRRSSGRLPTSVPLTIIVAPLVVVVVQVVGHDPAVELSRKATAENASEMIAAVEQYRAAHGDYPSSLVAVWPDYLPSVVGVQRYAYEPSGQAYNLSFEQFRFYPIGTREFVVYNPRDEQTMISHASWRMVAPDLEGYYAVHEAAWPHWKYFWFD